MQLPHQAAAPHPDPPPQKGPRKELTNDARPLKWEGNGGHPSLVRPKSIMAQEGPGCRAVSLQFMPCSEIHVPRQNFCSKKPRSQELQPTVTGDGLAHASSRGQSLHSLVASLSLIRMRKTGSCGLAGLGKKGTDVRTIFAYPDWVLWPDS